MSLLIDADFIVYKCCAATETEIDFGEDLIVVTSSFKEAYNYVERELASIANDLGCFDDSILFFSDSSNFRKVLDPAYKGHRTRKKTMRLQTSHQCTKRGLSSSYHANT